MTIRQLDILKNIIHEESSIDKLSRLYNLTSRMMHYEIDHINYYLKKFKLPQIVKKYGGCISIDTCNLRRIKEYISTIEISQELNPKDRANLFIMNIIYHKKIDSAVYFKEKNMTRSSKITTIAKAMELLQEFGLELVIYHNKMAEILGEENRIRNYILSLFYFYGDNTLSPVSMKVQELFTVNNQEYILDFIHKVQQDTGDIITDEAFYTIINYINIMLIRISNGSIVQKVNNSFFLSQTSWYKTILKNKPVLEKYYHTSIFETEIVQLSDYFVGCSSLNLSFSYYSNWVELNKIIKQIISNVGKTTGVPLFNDKELFYGLMNHIKPAIHRLKNKIDLINNAYDEVYETYPELYDIVSNSLLLLYDIFEINFSKNENALITVHFQAAIDRLRSSFQNQKKILLVCGMGFGTTMFLSQQLQQHFIIDIVDIIPLHLFQSSTINNRDIDCIITTIHIPKNEIDVPCIMVSPFLKNEDLKRLESEGLQKNSSPVFQLEEIITIINNHTTIHNKNALITELSGYFKQYIQHDILKKNNEINQYFPIENIKYTSVSTWQDAIRCAGKLLLSTQYIKQEYISNIIQNIEQLGSYMIDNEIAYPHAQSDHNVYKTGFSLLLLEEPIIFPNNSKVSIILTIASKDNKEHSNIMIRFSELFNHNEFKKLVVQKDIIKIYNYLVMQL